MINCLAIDDEPLALGQLASYIEKIPYLNLAGKCNSALEAQKMMVTTPVDAIFIDINMPDLNGLEFIQSLVSPPIVVLTTAYSEYAIEGYKVNAVDYLLKPFSLSDFNHAASKVKEKYELLHTNNAQSAIPQDSVSSDDNSLFVKSEHRMVRIDINNIKYVEGMSEYVRIHFCNETRPLTVLISMKKMEERLSASKFMRIHRSFIINLQHITEVNKNRVVIDGKDYIPIGDLYRDNLQEYVLRNTLEK